MLEFEFLNILSMRISENITGLQLLSPRQGRNIQRLSSHRLLTLISEIDI